MGEKPNEQDEAGATGRESAATSVSELSRGAGTAAGVADVDRDGMADERTESGGSAEERQKLFHPSNFREGAAAPAGAPAGVAVEGSGAGPTDAAETTIKHDHVYQHNQTDLQ